MKRALLITGGALGSLGVVFAITPPQIASNQSALDLGSTGTTPSAAPAATPTATTSSAVSTTAATSTPTKKPTKKPTQSAITPAPTQSTAAPTKTTPATQAPVAPATQTPTSKNISGTFAGALSSVGPYGGVITQITVASGKITDIQVLQAPGGKNQRYTELAIPTMRQRALAAQGDQITAVSGASYTSYNFWKSLTSAMTKAGLK